MHLGAHAEVMISKLCVWPTKHRACMVFLSQRSILEQSFMRKNTVLGGIRRHELSLSLETSVPPLTSFYKLL